MSRTQPTMTVELKFTGLNAPVLLRGCSELVPLIRRVMPDWQIDEGPAKSAPFFTISSTEGRKYRCVNASDPTAARDWNALNAVGDLVAEIAWEYIRTNPSLLCLHSAAVVFNGRLVLFPNARRAGKSTLAAVLAQRGYQVFTDDYLPVDPATGTHLGISMGILPRVRLPLPAGFSASFLDWVTVNTGPSNSQYKYLLSDAQARKGAKMPIGAIVCLERKDAGGPKLTSMIASEAIGQLIHQNFSRTIHSGAILKTMGALTDEVQMFALDYSDAEEAADTLIDAIGDWAARPVTSAKPHCAPVQADLTLLETPPDAFSETSQYQRAGGFTEVGVDGIAYLADASGLGVHRLNEGSVAIWRLLEHPADVDEISEVLTAAFPSVDPLQIYDDCKRTMIDFAQNRLVIKVEDEKRRQNG